MHRPDYSSSEEGFSDDNDYYEFKQRLKSQKKESIQNHVISEEQQKKNQFQSVFAAILSGSEVAVFSALDEGLNIDADLENGWTPLLLAATTANENLISQLLQRGADINQSRDGVTALMLICSIHNPSEDERKNVLKCTELLISKGADVNATDRKRRNALMFAAQNGHLEVVKLLLPLSDRNAQDNQRWTALFYAVDGNQPETFKFLLDENFNHQITDIRGNTVAEFAQSQDYEQILNLLPLKYDEVYCHLNNNPINIEETFSNLQPNAKPLFFNDICRFLFGCKSESVIPLLNDNEIGLFDFLSLNDPQLKSLGVKLPYQRNRILGELFKFHKYAFQPKSIPIVGKNQLYSNIDVSVMVVSCIKQLIAMEAALKFALNNLDGDLNVPKPQEIQILLARNKQQLRRVKIVAKQFVMETEKWDSVLEPVDKIGKKRRNIPWSNICFSVAVISLIILYKIN